MDNSAYQALYPFVKPSLKIPSCFFICNGYTLPTVHGHKWLLKQTNSNTAHNATVLTASKLAWSIIVVKTLEK
jgi:hypothetical protein